MKLENAIWVMKSEGLSVFRYVRVFSTARLKASILSFFNIRFSSLYYAVFGLCAALAISGCASNGESSAAVSSKVETIVTTSPMNIHVDHAWVKDASNPSQQETHRKTMATLREKIEAGGSFIASWNTLGADGTYWHVAEKETYSSDVIPEGARDIPVGSLSAILPGDGGLHLFRILGREPVK